MQIPNGKIYLEIGKETVIIRDNVNGELDVRKLQTILIVLELGRNLFSIVAIND